MCAHLLSQIKRKRQLLRGREGRRPRDAVHIVAEQLGKYVREVQDDPDGWRRTKEYWRQEGDDGDWYWWGKSTESTELTVHAPSETDWVSVLKFVTPVAGAYYVDNFG
jgi:hypothetical protein